MMTKKENREGHDNPKGRDAAWAARAARRLSPCLRPSDSVRGGLPWLPLRKRSCKTRRRRRSVGPVRRTARRTTRSSSGAGAKRSTTASCSCSISCRPVVHRRSSTLRKSRQTGPRTSCAPSSCWKSCVSLRTPSVRGVAHTDYVSQLQTQLEAYRAQCQCEPSIPTPAPDGDAHADIAHDDKHQCVAPSGSETESLSLSPKSESHEEPSTPRRPSPEPAELACDDDTCIADEPPKYEWPVYAVPPWDGRALEVWPRACYAPPWPRPCIHRPRPLHRHEVWHRDAHRSYCLCPPGPWHDEPRRAHRCAARLDFPKRAAHGRR